MVKKIIQKEKPGKKEKSQGNLKHRITWNFSPVSRVIESRKVYRRKTLRADKEETWHLLRSLVDCAFFRGVK